MVFDLLAINFEILATFLNLLAKISKILANYELQPQIFEYSPKLLI